jgi:hypothetical protein
MDYYGEDYDEAPDHNDDYDEEDIANGHELDEEDVEEVIKEKELYDSEEEKENFDEFEENDILGVEQEYDNTVDEFPSSSKKAEKEKINNDKMRKDADAWLKQFSDERKKNHDVKHKDNQCANFFLCAFTFSFALPSVIQTFPT